MTIKFPKKEEKGYRIGKAMYSEKNAKLATIETNLILNNL